MIAATAWAYQKCYWDGGRKEKYGSSKNSLIKKILEVISKIHKQLMGTKYKT